MSRKTTAALLAALGINFAMAGGAIILANLNKPAEFDLDTAFASSDVSLEEVAGIQVDSAAGDLAVPLKAAQRGGNTRVTFTCGKQVPSGRKVHEGTWDHISGAALYRPDEQKLVALQVVFDTRSLRTDAQALTNTVTVKEKWFDIEKHPTATFTCTEVRVVESATASHTHDLVGSFTLNGITKSIVIPVKLAYAGQSLTIEAAFTILRSDYDVQKRTTSLVGAVGDVVSKVEDEVELTVRVTAAPDLGPVVSELARQAQQHEEQLRVVDAELEALKRMTRRIELLEEHLDRQEPAPQGASPIYDADALPKAFTDHVPSYHNEQQAFGMVLVPGDSEQGIAPFYMSTHEVRWGMIDFWMYCHDIEGKLSKAEIQDLIDQGLRPSPLFGNPSIMVQTGDRNNPAIAVSMLTAKSYCKWLSEKTGRRYRLPTIDEWKHAMRLGGGLPKDLDDSVWHAGNVERDVLQKLLTAEVGSKKPNALGIYDMFGHACEWVTGTGLDKVVVGGHFHMPAKEISEDWQAVEDVEAWNTLHPQTPKGRFWISDFHYTGIRLICEPASVAANPPTNPPASSE